MNFLLPVPRRSQSAHAPAPVHHPVPGHRHPGWPLPWPFALFVLAGFSDGFDGLVARLTNQYTPLGQYLDPIADKLLLSTLFLVLTHMGLVPRYVTVLVFSRDLGILLISTLLFATGTLRDFRPSLLGKLNTLVQIFGLTIVLVDQVWPSVDMGLLRKNAAVRGRLARTDLRGPICLDRLPQNQPAPAPTALGLDVRLACVLPLGPYPAFAFRSFEISVHRC